MYKMEKLEPIDFQGKTVQIYKNTDWFTTTTDSVILCDFIKIHLKDKKILDLGSGIGTIPLLLSLKTNIEITGVEIQEDVYNLSKKSVSYNHLEDKIHLINCDMKCLDKVIEKETFDIVVSNPPYFPYQEEKVLSHDIHKKYARCEIAITLQELFETAKKMLKDNGRFIFIYRTDRLLDVLEALKLYQFEAKKIQFVFHSRESVSKLFLLEATKYGKRELKILPPLYINERKECSTCKKVMK